MSDTINVAALFERRIGYPDPGARQRLARLVGIYDQKQRLAKILGLLVNPAGLERWAKTHHPDADLLLDTVLRRPRSSPATLARAKPSLPRPSAMRSRARKISMSPCCRSACRRAGRGKSAK